MKTRWIAWLIIGCFVSMGMTNYVFAKDFPTKPINIYVGWGAGGGTSMMASVIASKVSEILGVPVIVMNKPGAGGTIANDVMLKSKPDGCSLSVTTSANNVLAPLLTKVSYKNSDFEFFGMFATNPMILYVSSASPWKTLEELIAYAKEHPRELKYPSAGIGTSVQVGMGMLSKAANIETIHVPMKSDPEMLSAILGGHCQVALGFMTTIQPVKEGGRVRFLAASTEQRLKAFPDVPTFAEKGYPSAVLIPWYGIGGPKGMPKEVSDKLRDAFEKAFQDNEVHQMLSKLGVTPSYMSADKFTKLVHSEEKRVRDISKELGLNVVE